MAVRNLHTQSRYAENIVSLSQLNRLAGKLYRSNPLNKKKVFMDISSEEVQLLFKSLNHFEVKYLLVGGMAGAVHGHIRTTQDMDLWVKNDPENTKALILTLAENDVAGSDLFLNVEYSLKAFSEADFDACYNRALQANFDDIPFSVIQLRDLITEKISTGRPKDLGDVEELQRIWEEQQIQGIQ